MALVSFLFSIFHALLLILAPTLTFLWIIGKLKAIREQQTPLNYHQQPSPSNFPLQPRRLSFSSAATTNTPTPTANLKRRVTFSLTPEQQANELLKTAVRRREALPSANLVIQNHSPTQHYQPQQQTAHLFPYNPPPSRPTLLSLNHQPIPIEQPSNPPHNPSNPLVQPLPKRSPSPNNTYNPLPKRYPSPRKPLPRPTSPPPYVANLVRPSRNNRFPQTIFNQPLQQRRENGFVQRSVR